MTSGAMKIPVEADASAFQYELQSISYEQGSTNGEVQAGAGKNNAERWARTCAVGLLAGCVALALDGASTFITDKRNALIVGSEHGFHIAGFVLFTCSNAVLVSLSSALALYWAPGSIGSGIPEVKAYLNGIGLKKEFTIKVFISKLVGVTLSYSSGLMVGPEGPLVHLGAMLGVFASPLSTPNRELRDFVSIGAASGFAVAFGAPIGGVLFTLEEASTFWSSSLMWRCLVATLVAMLGFLVLGNIVSTIFNGSSDDDDFSWASTNAGLLSLSGTRESSMVELPLFITIGALGGVIGALFNYSWAKKMKWFASNKFSRKTKFIFILSLSVLSSSIFYCVPPMFGNSVCRPRNRFTTDELSDLWIRELAA